MLNYREKVQEAKDIMEEFYILLSLSLDTKLKFKFEDKENRAFITIYNDMNPYIMRVCVYEDKIIVVLDKDRFSSGIFMHYKLRNYDKFTIPEQHDGGINLHKSWFITSNEPEMLRDVISVINKRVKVWNT